MAKSVQRQPKEKPFRHCNIHTERVREQQNLMKKRKRARVCIINSPECTAFIVISAIKFYDCLHLIRCTELDEVCFCSPLVPRTQLTNNCQNEELLTQLPVKCREGRN
jgi:hypothetical protein